MKTLIALVGSLVVAALANSWLVSIGGSSEVVQVLCTGFAIFLFVVSRILIAFIFPDGWTEKYQTPPCIHDIKPPVENYYIDSRTQYVDQRSIHFHNHKELP